MPHLIIGHTTDTHVRLWIRGETDCRRCDITLQPLSPEPGPPRRLPPVVVTPERDFTRVVDVDGLTPGTGYAVIATFGSREIVRGRFHTFPQAAGDVPPGFSFILSSCNLSVVSINNLVAFLVAAAGTAAAVSSLELPSNRWRQTPWTPLRRALRGPAQLAVRGVAWFVNTATEVKQPPPPYLRSPFLKLAAIFDAHVVQVEVPTVCVGDRYVVDGVRRLSTGDVVFTAGGSGVLACAPIAPMAAAAEGPVTWRLVLTRVEGHLDHHAVLFRGGSRKEPDVAVGRITSSSKALPWFDDPSFFIHAGDQIYYDFPHEDRVPSRAEYRRAYQEAWFDDDANRYVLSHWPHYMTLDDHEIADQFALDFNAPGAATTAHGAPGLRDPRTAAQRYRTEATAAYDEYVHARHPPASAFGRGHATPASRWYHFDKGSTRFFVLDTRLERKNSEGGGSEHGQIVDEGQLQALLDWMDAYRDDLKFVVTSVPFVAEVRDDQPRETKKWHAAGTVRNPTNDKWCAPRFRRQRHRIITHIAQHRIDRLVFLTGDMHCCYHATMQIGGGGAARKYTSCVVHELAGGPINQLQLAKMGEFHARRVGRTSAGEGDLPYEVVLEQFHSEVNAVMHIAVRYVERDLVAVPHGQGPTRGIVPEVEWNVVRTLTDNGAGAWLSQAEVETFRRARQAHPEEEPPQMGEPVMCGRITFTQRRMHAAPTEAVPGRLQAW